MFRQLHMIAAADMRLYTLLLFFIVFMAVLVRFLVVARRDDFLWLSQLPLRGDDARAPDVQRGTSTGAPATERKDETR